MRLLTLPLSPESFDLRLLWRPRSDPTLSVCYGRTPDLGESVESMSLWKFLHVVFDKYLSTFDIQYKCFKLLSFFFLPPSTFFARCLESGEAILRGSPKPHLRYSEKKPHESLFPQLKKKKKDRLPNCPVA